MATVIEHIGFFYPYLLDEADPRYVPAAILDQAIAVAADWRPTCLSEDRQNQAQAHYVAYLAAVRLQTIAEGAGGTVTETVAGPIIEKAEGDVRVRYATSGGTTTTTTTARNANTGPNTPYAAWERLWAICAGAELAEGRVPPRRGAIMTSAG